MRIRFDRETRYSLIIFAALLIALQIEVNRMVLLVGICIVLFLSGSCMKERTYSKALEEIKKICRYDAVIISIFTAIQILVIGLGFHGAIVDIEIMACVYIGIICGAVSIKQYISFETYLKAILMFMIVYSSYYISGIAAKGLPEIAFHDSAEGRASVFGNVSSNFCSAVLYFCYPVIIYYLFGRRKDAGRKRSLDKACYAAIALSMIVILSSGSRTAIGVVALMAVQIVLYRHNSFKTKKRIIIILAAMLVGLIIAYNFNSTVHDLMERSLDAFGGKKTLNSDVRQLIWASGARQFYKGNIMLGLGTNIVEQFVRPAHNLFYEVLMCSGYLGILMFVTISGVLIFIVMKNQSYPQRFFSVMILIACVITALVQPFFSTSYICGMIVWMSLFMLTADAERVRP